MKIGNNILEFPLDALQKLVQTNTVVEMHRLLPPGEVPNPQRLEAILDNLGFPQFWSKKQRSIVTIYHYMD